MYMYICTLTFSGSGVRHFSISAKLCFSCLRDSICLYVCFYSDEPPADRNAKYFKFKMEALIAHLKKQSEQGSAPYYNIDILKYQVCAVWFC